LSRVFNDALEAAVPRAQARPLQTFLNMIN
jgi:hypothetical protein